MLGNKPWKRAQGAIALAAVLFLPRPAMPGEDAIDRKALDGLRQRWESAMQDLRIPGMAVVVVQGDDVILLETIGLRDPEKNLPVTPDTAFYIASCTKTFTAMAVLALVEDGKVELNEPVRTYLPRLAIDKHPTITERVTARDLLSHAKGINSGPIVYLDAFTGEITEDRYFRHLQEATASGTVGYTNVHYTLLGRVIESVTGKSWRDFLDERLFVPAGMKSATAYASQIYGGSDAAIPYVFENEKLRPARTRKTDRTMHAAGGTGASINDMAQWLRLNLNGGTIDGNKIVSPQTIQAMQTLETKITSGGSDIPGRKRLGYGLGWFVADFNGHRMVEHGGGYLGTSAVFALIPEKNIGMAAMVNSDTPLPLVATVDIFGRLLQVDSPDLIPQLRQLSKRSWERRNSRLKSLGTNPAKAPQGLSLPPDSYVGQYVNDDWGTVQVQLVDGELTASIGDLPLLLGSNGIDSFQYMSEGEKPLPGRFEPAAKSIVQSVWLKVDEELEEVRFDRQ